MSLRRLLLRFANAFRSGAAEDELARETDAHLSLLEDEYQRRGMTAEQARLAAKNAFAVTCRTREIGVRVAMGAQRSDIIGMVVRHGMGLVGLGAAAGLALAAASSRLLSGLLFGIPPMDPVTFVG